MIRRFLCLFLLLAGATASFDARAWWNDDWAFRKEITLDLSPAAGAVAEGATDVPVLLRLSMGNFEFFGDTKPDGSDFRVLAEDDKTALKFHLERYDPQSQMAFIWVRVPALAAGGATKLFLYYGNAEAPAAADAAGTYDRNQALVYHFGPAAGTAQDATGYKSEPAAFQAEVNAAALIGAGAKLNGTGSITVPATGALQLVPAQGHTASAWVKIDAAQSQAYVLSQADAASSLILGIDGVTPFVELRSGATTAARVAATTPLATGEWTHLALRLGAGKLTLFVNGVAAGTADATIPVIGGTFSVGASASNANHLTGELDELQVSNVARTDAWVAVLAKSQGVVAPLIVYGGDAQKEGGGEGYFTTTMRNVTVDGWVVIVFCLLLLVLSLVIMAGKLVYLNRVARANEKFLEEFRQTGGDPAEMARREHAATIGVPAAPALTGQGAASTARVDRFGGSLLYQLYQDGMRESRQRLEGQSAGAARVESLSPQAIESIRATLDAAATRATQKLQSQMVWLTISISGGPFLGLLGTVVGVMITFAAIAQSGDVNVNAIAPGIAAALAATVAGLGVAIPCLFGYNYLNTRIKDIVADMRVFIDELVARLAENYS
jgi:biopolymer transport protein ExbB